MSNEMGDQLTLFVAASCTRDIKLKRLKTKVDAVNAWLGTLTGKPPAVAPEFWEAVEFLRSETVALDRKAEFQFGKIIGLLLRAGERYNLLDLRHELRHCVLPSEGA